MKQQKHFIVDVLFVLALFGVFSISALVLVTIGADVYQNTVADMSANYETRASVSYLTEKIRQNDTQGNISLSTLEDTPALVLSTEVNEESYATYLYLYEGHLKELLMKQDSSLGGDLRKAGTDILELSDLSMTWVSSNLLSILLETPNGDTYTIYVSTHCSNEY